jgi:hypothetical protein
MIESKLRQVSRAWHALAQAELQRAAHPDCPRREARIRIGRAAELLELWGCAGYQ